MLNYKKLLFSLILLLSVPATLSAEEVRFNCERTKIDYMGFGSARAAESWYRKKCISQN